MQTQQKVYDFPFEQVKTQVKRGLSKNANQGTVPDLVTLTGLPKYQIEKTLPVVADECSGQLKVTESGQILYYFPQGLKSKNKKTWFQNALDKVFHFLTKAGTFLFKIWIMLMLVGFFFIFILLIVIALIASLVLSFVRRDDNDSGGDGLLGFFLIENVLEFFMLFWLYSGTTDLKQKKKKKPFYKAVFDYVFGIQGQDQAWSRQERKTILHWIKAKKGLVSIEETMAFTGRSREEANALLTHLALEIEGEPQVTEQGTLYFFYPVLLSSSIKNVAADLPEQPLLKNNTNPGSTNGWISFFGIFNMLFGLYFLVFGLRSDGMNDPGAFLYNLASVLSAFFFFPNNQQALVAGQHLVTLVLGALPLVYSLLFFGIPLIRGLKEKKSNEKIKTRNLRRKLINTFFNKINHLDLNEIQPDAEQNAPGKPGETREKLKESMVQDFADTRNLEVEETSDKRILFSLPELQREKEDLQNQRETIDPQKYDQGKVVFDSGE